MENNKTESTIDPTTLDSFKSLSVSNREDDEEIVCLALDKGVTPQKIRYGMHNQSRRGVVEDVNKSLYYFSYVPGEAFKLVKAESKDQLWDANRFLNKCILGCDFVAKSDTDEEEDTEKAAGAPTGGQPKPSGALPISEEQSVEMQDQLLTQEHPGAIGTESSDDSEDGIGRDWHANNQVQKNLDQVPLPPVQTTGTHWSYSDLLKGLGQQLQDAVPVSVRPPSDREAQFMTEVLGRTPQEVQQGHVGMNPTQRAQYNRWLTKSTRTGLSKLIDWQKRHG